MHPPGTMVSSFASLLKRFGMVTTWCTTYLPKVDAPRSSPVVWARVRCAPKSVLLYFTTRASATLPIPAKAPNTTFAGFMMVRRDIVREVGGLWVWVMPVIQ